MKNEPDIYGKLRVFIDGLFSKYARQSDHTFSIGNVELGVANDFAPLTDWMQEAFEHSTLPSGATVTCVYDKVDFADVAPWRAAAFGQRILALLKIGCRGFLNDETNVFEVFDQRANQGLRIVPNPSSIPIWESTAPLANFAAWSNADKSSVMLHAAVVGTKTRGCLLCGPGGSGKSLLTLAAALGGLSTVGDDYVLLRKTTKKGFEAKPYSKLAKQTPRGLALLGAVGQRMSEGPLNWSGKRCFSIDDLAPGMFANALPVHSVVSVQLEQSPSIEPLSPRVAFDEIVRSTEQQIPAMIDILFPFVGDLTKRCPVYRLKLGPDTRANVGVLKTLLAGECV